MRVVTDLAPGGARSQTCPECGAQNPADATRCADCGAALDVDVGAEAERDDLETVELERAAGAAGFDTEFAVEGDTLVCPACGHRFSLDDARVHAAMDAQDTASSSAEASVVTCNCPRCAVAGHAVIGLRDSAPQSEGGTS